MTSKDTVGNKAPKDLFPRGEEVEQDIRKRRRAGTIWRTIFLGATVFAVIVLSVLLLKIINDSMGLVAEEAAIPERELLRAYHEGRLTAAPNSAPGGEGDPVETAESLADLPYDALVGIYATNVSRGRCRAVEREQRFVADSLVCETEELFAQVCASDNPAAACALGPRDSAQVIRLIRADVIKPKVVATWNALESITNREEILATAARRFPNTEVYFKSWLSWRFLTSPQSSFPEIAGIRTALLGTLWVVGIAVLVSFPLGVGAAVYLEEYADSRSRLNRIIQTNINNLAGVPSIIYGLLGLAVFVRALEPITSGAIFGAGDAAATANGRTVLSAGLTLALLGLPVIIISAQEAIRAVPSSLRQASYGLGATKWQTVRSHVLPNAVAGITTGVILSMSRIIGETAPLVVVGASTFITTDPDGPFSKFTALPVQIYQWTARPQDAYRDIAAATIIVLLLLLLLLNATAIFLRNRYGKRLG